MVSRLEAYSRVCSGISYKDVVGIQQQGDHLLATLTKHMVLLYKVSDAAAVCSWSSRKTHRITAPVITKDGDFIAVLNNNIIIQWKQDNDTNLSDLSKCQFSTAIHCVFDVPDIGLHILYSNGCIEPLSVCMLDRELRKEDKQAKCGDKETIVDYTVNSQNSHGFKLILMLQTHHGRNVVLVLSVAGVSVEIVSKFTLMKADSTLMGHCFTQPQQHTSLVCLWSDGSITSRDVASDSTHSYGTTLHHCTSIDTSQPAALVPLPTSHIAIYGAAHNKEGAELLLWSLGYGLCVCKHKIKMYCSPPHMWAAHNNLYLPVGQELLLIPYTLKPATLLSVIGNLKQDSCTEIVKWGEDDAMDVAEIKITDNCVDQQRQLEEIEQEFTSTATTEALMSGEVNKVLRSKNDLELIAYSIEHYSMLPEEVICQTLNYYLNLPQHAYTHIHTYLKPHTDAMMEHTRTDAVHVEMLGTPAPSPPVNPWCWEKCYLVNRLLRKQTSDMSVRRLIKQVEFSGCVELVEYLHYLLHVAPHDGTLEEWPTMEEVMRWICVLVDSHYNQLVMTQDDKVIKLLCYLSDAVNRQAELCDDLEEINNVLVNLRNKKHVNQQHDSNMLYNIKLIKLY